MSGELRMLDSIYVANLPAGADAYLGYADGRWATAVDLKARFPGARILILAVFAADDAEGLDIEAGDATDAEVYDWFTRQQKRRVWRPVLYTSAANAGALLATMAANGFARPSFRLLSAHYGAGQHICGPSSCGFPQADATQWTDSAPGNGGAWIDESLLAADFFAGAPMPPPVPQPMNLAVLASGEDMFVLAFDSAGNAPLSIPAFLPDGVTPVSGLQLVTTGPASVQVAFDGGGYGSPVSLDWSRGAETVPVPAGAGAAKVQRLDSGGNYVAAVFA